MLFVFCSIQNIETASGYNEQRNEVATYCFPGVQKTRSMYTHFTALVPSGTMPPENEETDILTSGHQIGTKNMRNRLCHYWNRRASHEPKRPADTSADCNKNNYLKGTMSRRRLRGVKATRAIFRSTIIYILHICKWVWEPNKTTILQSSACQKTLFVQTARMLLHQPYNQKKRPS